MSGAGRMEMTLLVFLSVSAVNSQNIDYVKSDCHRLLTFNTGLTQTIKDYETRRINLLLQLLHESAEVVCLQEVWREEDTRNLVTYFQEKYPYHYSAIHNSVGDLGCPKPPVLLPYEETPVCRGHGACRLSEVAYFYTVILGCATVNGCILKSGSEKMHCVANKCRHVLNYKGFSADCLSCIGIMSPPGSLSVSQCRHYLNRLNSPGLLMLSKKPLGEAKFVRYFPEARMFLTRGYLTAVHPDLGRIYCTHPSSTTGPYLEYNMTLTNYTQQLYEEITTLLADCGRTQEPVILMGDFNTGPVVSSSGPEKNIHPANTESYQRILDAGFRTSYLEQDGRCTYCKSNPYTSENYNELIDFIFLKGHNYSSVTSKRVLDVKPVSDHYGVKTIVCKST